MSTKKFAEEFIYFSNKVYGFGFSYNLLRTTPRLCDFYLAFYSVRIDPSMQYSWMKTRGELMICVLGSTAIARVEQTHKKSKM